MASLPRDVAETVPPPPDVDEYETTIQVALFAHDYDRLLAAHVTSLAEQRTYVFYYADESRLACGDDDVWRYQRKNTVSETRTAVPLTLDDCRPPDFAAAVLDRLQPHGVRHNFRQRTVLLPATHRHSVESTRCSRPDPTTVTAVTERHVLEQQGGRACRISIERRANTVTDQGKMYLVAEMEYDRQTYATPRLRDVCEQRLTECLAPYMTNINVAITYDPVTCLTLCTAPSRRFVSLMELCGGDVTRYKYKLDGHKGRICYTGRETLFHDDQELDQSVATGGSGGGIEFCLSRNYPNVVFQVEVMSDPCTVCRMCRGVLVITDIIGFYSDHMLYMPSPRTVGMIFDTAPPINLGHVCVQFQSAGQKRILVQAYVHPPPTCPAVLSPLQQLSHDGHILETDYVQSKSKVATIDVRAHKGYLYLEASNATKEAICKQHFPGATDGAICEVAMCDNRYVMLRERHDRWVTSTTEQYHAFRRDNAWLHRQRFSNDTVSHWTGRAANTGGHTTTTSIRPSSMLAFATSFCVRGGDGD